MFNLKNIKENKKYKISTSILITMTLLITCSTLGISIYAMFFLNKIMHTQGEIFQQVLVFQESLQRLVLAFLVFGLLASYYLSKLILNPLNSLINAIQEFAKGDLDYRIRPSKYEEIDSLITTYNKMAENLKSLYDDLETKVKERTVELENANEELKNTQAMMVHSEKMKSLGELVAGITHEINNPVNFIHGNLIHLKSYTEALIQIIDAYENIDSELSEEMQEKLSKIKESLELDFIKDDLPSLIESCREGTTRTKNIILDLKNFSRLDEVVLNEIDIPKEIDTTLNILHSKLKNKVEVIKEYDDNLPYIEGYGGQLNQVFMNIIDNAAYAIKEKGTITIRLQKQGDNVIMEFEDTGCGMTEEQCKKVFDPFYTTKPVGAGTGLGMSISYKVIKRHNGTIEVTSELGKGSKFRITLPLFVQDIKLEKDT